MSESYYWFKRIRMKTSHEMKFYLDFYDKLGVFILLDRGMFHKKKTEI